MKHVDPPDYPMPKPKSVDEHMSDGASLERGLSGRMEVDRGYEIGQPSRKRRVHGEPGYDENRAGAKTYGDF